MSRPVDEHEEPRVEGTVPRQVKEYGLSHADLARILPRFWPGATLEGDATRGWRFDLGGGRGFTVLPGAELLRRIGQIRMPYLQVCVEFDGFTAEEIDAFWIRFNRSFHKGGG